MFRGTSGIDIDLRRVDINQCHVNGSSFNIFGGTDKCKKETTMVGLPESHITLF
jgi:G protein-coupled receptor 158